jgi:hypothetical protein
VLWCNQQQWPKDWRTGFRALFNTLTKNVKLKFKVLLGDYVKEVGCRCKERGIRINKCSNKKKELMKEELYKMPITEQEDIDWLIGKEAQFLRALEAAAAEKRPTAAPKADSDNKGMAPDGMQNPAWCTALPYLRLYCCLTLDDVKVAMNGRTIPCHG